MCTEIRRIQQEVGITAIYVTHDQSEAMALSDNIIIMNKGVAAQMGSYQNYHVKVGDTLMKFTDYNPKNKRVYQAGEKCSLVFDPESVHIL